MSQIVRTLSLCAMAGVTVFASACSGGGHSTSVAPVVPVPASTAGGASSASSAGFTYNAALVSKSTLLHAASFGTLTIDVALKMRDAAGLFTYAKAVSDRKNSNYRHFLTPDQIADRFAASAADRDAAVADLRGHGLTVGGWRQRMLLRVVGSQANLESAFHTKFGLYSAADGTQFFAPMSAPHVDTGVPIVGSANIARLPKRYVSSKVGISQGIASGYSPQQTATVFDYNGAYAAGYTGSGITIGIVGTGPIQTSTGGRIGDFETYKQLYGVAGASTVTEVPTTSSDPVINSSSGFASPPPVTAPCTASSIPNLPPSEFPTANCNPEDGEAQIDTEQSGTLARDASVQFYLAYNPNACEPTYTVGQPCAAGSGFAVQGLAVPDEELQTVIDHNTADVVSLSYGGSEFSQVGTPGQSPPNEFSTDGTGLDPTEFAMMVTEGMAIFVSSGDQGANICQASGGPVDGLCVSYPATDPSVVAVGAVTTPLNAAGQQIGPISAWGLQTSAGGSGTGGGVSAYFAQPAFQLGLPGIVGSTRNIPDVALNGDPATGVALLVNADPSLGGASLFPIGGTSVSAPQMAAMWALVLQACKSTPSCVAKGSGAYPYRLGDPDPAYYGIYANAKEYATTFLPVTYGDNALAVYCYYNSSDTMNCPAPAPGATATPQPVPIPLDPGYSANPNGGYNQLTGIGVPFARALIKTVVGV